MRRASIKRRPGATKAMRKNAEQIQVCSASTTLGRFIKYVWEQKLTHGEKDHMKAMANVDVNRVVSTACSGSGMGEIAFSAVMQFLGKAAKLSYSCENVPFKQRFLISIIHPQIDTHGEACLFKDMKHLSDGSAECMIHGSTCTIKHHEFLTIVGYSCKTLSRNNPAKKSKPKKRKS